MTTKSKLLCVWGMGDACSGEIEEVEFFDSQIKVPVCANHIEQHKFVMILAKNDYDVEEILQETSEYRKGEVLLLKLSGLDNTDDVDL